MVLTKPTTDPTLSRNAPMSKPLNIGMIGYGFMGRAHSNAYRQVSQFFQREHRPVLKACCARKEDKIEAFAENWGYESYETDWRKLDRAQGHRRHRHRLAQQHAQGDRAGGRQGRQDDPLRKAAGHERGRGRGDVRRGRKGRRAQHGVVQLSPRAGHFAGQAGGRRRPHRPAVPLSGHVPARLDDRHRRAAGGCGLVAARR